MERMYDSESRAVVLRFDERDTFLQRQAVLQHTLHIYSRGNIFPLMPDPNQNEHKIEVGQPFCQVSALDSIDRAYARS